MPMHDLFSFSGKRIEAQNGGQIITGNVISTSSRSNYLTLLVDNTGQNSHVILSPDDGWTFKEIFELPKNIFSVVRVGSGFFTRVGANEWQDEYGVLVTNMSVLRGFKRGDGDVLYEGVSK